MNLYGTHSIEVAEEQQRSRTAQLGAPIDHLAYYPNEHLQTIDDGIAHYPYVIPHAPPFHRYSSTLSQEEIPNVPRSLSLSTLRNSNGVEGPSRSGEHRDSGVRSKAPLALEIESGRSKERIRYDLGHRHRIEGGPETPQTKLIFDAEVFPGVDDLTEAENAVVNTILNELGKEGRVVIDSPTKASEAFWLVSPWREKACKKKEQTDSSEESLISNDLRFKIAVSELYSSKSKWLSWWNKRFPGANEAHQQAQQRHPGCYNWEQTLLCHMFYIDMIHTIVRKPGGERFIGLNEDPEDKRMWEKAYDYLENQNIFDKRPQQSIHTMLWYLNRIFLKKAESEHRKAIAFRDKLIPRETKFFFDFIFKHSITKLTERLPP